MTTLPSSQATPTPRPGAAERLAGFWIDERIERALDHAFGQIVAYQRDGFCTENDVAQAINAWGGAVEESWRVYAESRLGGAS